jgi:predicted amidohydrolase YtcJ
MKNVRSNGIVFSNILIAIAVLIFSGTASAAGLPAELVVLNANIITVDDENPRAEALAVSGGKFAAVGSSKEIGELVGEGTTVIDAEGKTITPGFIDAHTHPMPSYPFFPMMQIVDLGPDKAGTMDQVIALLREKAKATPKGALIMGAKYQDTKLGRHPTRLDLDKASAEHPIVILHSSGHMGVANSKALKIAGVTAETPDPPGGAFDKDESGQPNGICREVALKMLSMKMPPRPPTTEEALGEIWYFTRNCVSKGITSVADAKANPALIGLYQNAIEANRVNGVRIYLMIEDEYLDDLRQLKLRTGFGDDRLKIGAIKIYHGNSLSGRTCWLSEPYDTVNPETGEKDYFGIPPKRSQEELDELVFAAHKAGFHCAIHSNGDREIDMVLKAYEKALVKLPREDHRHRIEHCSVTTPAILDKVKGLGVVLVLHSYIYEHGDKMQAYGKERWGMMHPNCSAIELGVPVAGSSDSPVSAADPLLRIQSMVTRKTAEGKVYGPEQKVTVEQAIRIWTLGGAYASFEEDIKGSIETGKLADFIILSDDPTKVPSDNIKDVRVEKTVIGGKIVFEGK